MNKFETSLLQVLSSIDESLKAIASGKPVTKPSLVKAKKPASPKPPKPPKVAKAPKTPKAPEAPAPGT